MRAIVGVCPLVVLKVVVLSEALGAEFTHERLLSLVEAGVGLEVRSRGESLVAVLVGALVWLLSTVYHQMFLEVGLLFECLCTLITLEWLFSGMDPHVYLEFGLLRKDLVAMHAIYAPDFLLCSGPQLRFYDFIDGAHCLGLDNTIIIPKPDC